MPDEFLIKPIRSPADHRRAVREIERLMDAAPGSREADRLDVLATLVDANEVAHLPIEAPDPIEAIRFRMEQLGLKAADLTAYIGHSGRVTEVLKYQRSLTLPMIRRLEHGLGIPASVLIREVPPPSVKRRVGAGKAASGGKKGGTLRRLRSKAR